MGSRARVAGILRSSSPYELKSVAGRNVYIKRMDKINYLGLSGNKAYKLLHLALSDPFPPCVVSMGGCQGNLMLSLARVLHEKNKEAGGGHAGYYYTRSIPGHVKETPSGNYKEALTLGLKIIEIDRADYSALSARGQPDSFLVQRLCPTSATPLWLPQGGSAQGSMLGVSLLADDVVDFIRDSQQRNDIETREMSKNWKIIACTGTGITALLLATRINDLRDQWGKYVDNIEVVAIPCAMKRGQLLESLQAYKNSCKNGVELANRLVLPTVLDVSCGWIPFGKINKNLFSTWNYVQEQTGINFDLTYAPATWRQVLHDWNSTIDKSTFATESVRDNVIYLHCGGQESNASQLNRYRRKWPDLCGDQAANVVSI